MEQIGKFYLLTSLLGAYLTSLRRGKRQNRSTSLLDEQTGQLNSALCLIV
jgi:hypothetical protein